MASLATLQTVVEPSPDDLPGFSSIGILLKFLEPPIELGLLSLGQGDVRPPGGDAVPETSWMRSAMDSLLKSNSVLRMLRVSPAAVATASAFPVPLTKS